jgi:hypothetical protein
MRSAHYSRTLQLGLVASFVAAGAWGGYEALQAPASPTDVALDVSDLRARAAALVTLLDERDRGTLTRLFLRAQRRQWQHAVQSVNEDLAKAASNGEATAQRAHDTAVALLRLGDTFVETPRGDAARADAQRILDELMAQQRAGQR